MAYLLALSIAANLALAGLFLRHIGRREGAQDKERGLLLQRIQAPEVAVAQLAVPAGQIEGLPFVPFDDDEAYHQNLEDRLNPHANGSND